MFFEQVYTIGQNLGMKVSDIFTYFHSKLLHFRKLTLIKNAVLKRKYWQEQLVFFNINPMKHARLLIFIFEFFTG